ncbi:MAG TPA: hypothetical protein PLK76_04140 [bacterium]|nr:hypothetical protein [bacterium]
MYKGKLFLSIMIGIFIASPTISVQACKNGDCFKCYLVPFIFATITALVIYLGLDKNFRN